MHGDPHARRFHRARRCRRVSVMHERVDAGNNMWFWNHSKPLILNGGELHPFLSEPHINEIIIMKMWMFKGQKYETLNHLISQKV